METMKLWRPDFGLWPSHLTLGKEMHASLSSYLIGALMMLAAFSLASCSKKYELLEHESNFGSAIINGKAYHDYLTVAEAVSNKFFYTPLHDSGKFLISNDSVAYLQFVLRDDSANSIHESWLVLVGIPIHDGEDFPVVGKEYPIQYSPLTDHTFSGGGNFYERKMLEQIKVDHSADLPSGIGGIKVPLDIEFISLRGSLTFTDSTPSKDNTKVNYTGLYILENQPDEENGKISINGKFNLTLE